jgi:hypothetical protein
MALSPACRKKLGGLADHAERLIRDVIRERGGTAANVNKAGLWADRTLAEAASAAVENDDETAETAIKIAKQAKRLGRKRRTE